MFQVGVILSTIADLFPKVTIQFDIIELFHLRRDRVTFHSSINRVQEASVMHKFEKEVSELRELRENKFHNSVVVFLEKA